MLDLDVREHHPVARLGGRSLRWSPCSVCSPAGSSLPFASSVKPLVPRGNGRMANPCSASSVRISSRRLFASRMPFGRSTLVGVTCWKRRSTGAETVVRPIGYLACLRVDDDLTLRCNPSQPAKRQSAHRRERNQARTRPQDCAALRSSQVLSKITGAIQASSETVDHGSLPCTRSALMQKIALFEHDLQMPEPCWASQCEGYGLQPVHRGHKIGRALATEGMPLQAEPLSQPPKIR